VFTSRDRWKWLDAIFYRCLELPPEARSAFLDQNCGSDHELRKELEALLQEVEEPIDSLQLPVLEAAHALIGHSERTTLASGTRLDHYEIISLLAIGGMGQIYLAEDTTLQRRVALKVLPLEFTDDEHALQRFGREALAASALNHPNIVTIHECGQADGLRFIVSELVEGSTLREKLANGRFELNAILDIALQIASALDAAHSAGIIHRDIKPENLMVRRDGLLKVLDFGIAKLSRPRGLNLPTDGARTSVTKPAMLIGTAAYMSPEQATGKELDARTDLFSFGVVLYEITTGVSPFSADTTGAILERILTHPPAAVTQLNPEAPKELEEIITKALEKDRALRYQHASEMRADLQRLKRDSESGKGTATLVVSQVRRKRILWLGAGIGLVLLAAIGWGAYSHFIPKPAPFQQIEITQLTGNGRVKTAAISPDGKYVAYAVDELGETDFGVPGLPGGRTKESLWVRQVAGGDVQVAPAAEVGYWGLTFSRDGDFLYAVRSEGKNVGFGFLYKIPVLGGAVKRLIAEVDTRVTLSPNGHELAFVRNHAGGDDSKVLVANEDGSGEREVAGHKVPFIFVSPAWSPDGRTIAAVIFNTEKDHSWSNVVEIPAQGGSEVALTSKQQWAWNGDLAWLPDGRGLIANTKILGKPKQIEYLSHTERELRSITTDTNDYEGSSLTADSRILATIQEKSSFDAWVSPIAKSEAAKPITSGGTSAQEVWTPNGKIVYDRLGALAQTNIWIMDSDGSNTRQLTASTGRINQAPRVSGDGRYIVFVSDRSGNPHLWRMDIDGNDPIQLTNSPEEFLVFGSPECTPDGKWVFYSKGRPDAGIWKVSIEGGNPVRISNGQSNSHPAVSPDGKMLAFSYDELSGRNGVEIVALVGDAPVKQFDIATTTIRWTPDSRSFLYIKNEGGVSNIWSQPISGEAPKQISHFNSLLIANFDLSRDGKQLVMNRGTANRDVVLIRDMK
jgi:Tol biopolymer transport system component